MLYFCLTGNLKMCRYLFYSRGVDCRATDKYGRCPMYMAALGGRLEIIEWLCHECGAHEDIRKIDYAGNTPLYIALLNGRFQVAQWLILKGALAPRDDVDGGGIDDAIMRRDLRQGRNWCFDRRLPLVSWAHDAVTAHENFQFFLTGTALFSPDETRTSFSLSSSLLVRIFNGQQQPDILEVISHYVEENTEQELRMFRQLLDRLPRFIKDVPFGANVEEKDL